MSSTTSSPGQSSPAPAPRLAPDWLLHAEVGLCPCGCIGRRRKGNFVAKTLNGGSNLVRQAIFSEDIAATPGVLQRVDARIKVIGLLGLLLAAAFVRTIPVLIAMYVATVVLALASRLPFVLFLKRVWLFVPIFTGIVVLPATLNLITPGHIVVPLGHWFGGTVGITNTGLESAGLIVMRVALSISLVVLLTLTTPWHRLLGSLRSLRMPTIVVMVVAMAYRYLFHLLTSVGDMYTARCARTVGVDTDVQSGRRFVAASAGALFGKAHQLSDEVYQAMVARGFDGNVRTLSTPSLRATDGVFVVACALAAAFMLGVDHVIG